MHEGRSTGPYSPLDLQDAAFADFLCIAFMLFGPLKVYIFRTSWAKLAKFVQLSDLLCRFPLTTFSKKISKKISKKNFKKNFRKFFVNFFSQFFLGYHGSTFNLEHACKNLGGLGPLVWEEMENTQTVHKPKLKFI
jgi:hypothetical protein